ncbi:MAG: radical SAM family heme chaperone HemW [Burkholderiaceae bacterium]
MAGGVPAPVSQSGAGSSVSLTAPPPLAIYVHLPWCIRKCPYCDFNSHQLPTDDLPEHEYIDALISDLDHSLPSIWGRTVQTIFIGGGTPSLFTPDSIDRLLGAIRARVRLNADAEITLEANPGTFEQARFEGFAQAGVNRLSLGVQSFNDEHLRRLGRVHDAKSAHAAAQMAGQAFKTFNLDLMYALPGQSIDQLHQDLQAAFSHSPPHLSCYHLTMEPNTAFAVNPPTDLPDDDLAADMADAVVAATQSNGLDRYEVSAFARQNHRSRHNLNYWQFGDYLGLGAGAHSKLSSHQGIMRETRVRHPAQYLKAVANGEVVHQRRMLEPNDLPFEFMLNALRLVEGVPVSLFSERCGLDPAVMMPIVQQAWRDGLLTADPTRFQPTDKGFAFLNELQVRFLADSAS